MCRDVVGSEHDECQANVLVRQSTWRQTYMNAYVRV
jgi:hypothetical protein